MPIDDHENGEVTFVNTFAVHASGSEFEQAFAETAIFMQRQDGFLGHTLLRHTEDPARYMNIARWRDAASLQRAVQHPDFPAHAAAVRSLSTSDGGLFTACQTRAPKGPAAAGRERS